MKLLALDTSSDACSCALRIDDAIVQRHAVAPRQHAAMILDMLDTVMAEGGVGLHDIDAVAFGRGPGSFTGVRIAVSVAQGIALGKSLPLVPVSSLMTLAQGEVRRSGASHVLAAFDARMQQVYWGGYALADGVLTTVVSEQVADPDAVAVPGSGDWVGVGQGWAAYAQALRARTGARVTRTDADAMPEAQDLAQLAGALFARGAVVDIADAAPVYLRNNVATAKVSAG